MREAYKRNDDYKWKGYQFLVSVHSPMDNEHTHIYDYMDSIV